MSGSRTHGGQIGISFLIEKSKSANKYSFMRGLFDAGKTKMYVNRGIGTMHVPIRFFNRPEITLFEIKKIASHAPKGEGTYLIETFENLPIVVTPAKAGVQKVLKRLDTGFRRYDDLPNFRRNSKVSDNQWLIKLLRRLLASSNDKGHAFQKLLPGINVGLS